jgi:hypothetical protein
MRDKEVCGQNGRIQLLEDQMDFVLSILWKCEATKGIAAELEEMFEDPACDICDK